MDTRVRGSLLRRPPTPSTRHIVLKRYYEIMSKDLMNLPHAITTDRLSDRVQEALKAVPREFWELDEERLEIKAKPNWTDYRMRRALWVEVSKNTGLLDSKRICLCAGVEQRYFYHMLASPIKTAFLFSPAHNYIDELENVIEVSMKRLREALGANIVDEDNNLKIGAAKTILEIFKLASDRVHGQAAQKIHVDSRITKVDASPNLTLEEIQARIKELERAKDIMDVDDLAPYAVTQTGESKSYDK